MFKKILLLIVIAAIGAWAAGYDFGQLKTDIQSLVNSTTEKLSGDTAASRDGWGS